MVCRLCEEALKFSDADRDLTAALANNPSDKAVDYYAHLFAVRSAAALGRLGEAQAQADAALALFPKAQSAPVAASQVALARDEPDRAWQYVEGLNDTPGSLAFPFPDPWWE
jgi:hypothetical protein